MKSPTSEYLKIKYSKIHGNGGFAKKDIKKGTKIIEYVGNILTKKEAEKVPDKEGIFLFELNNKYDIDGNVSWNQAKWINHSCDSNCNAKTTKNQIWIIAKRDIKKGEELSYDYGFSIDSYKNYPCKCGAKNCIGYIVNKKHWKKIKKKWTIDDLAKKDEYHTRRWETHYTKKEYLSVNKELIKELNKLIKQKKLKKPKDYFSAAIILHHRYTLSTSKKALVYSKIAYKKGYKKGKWLIASITDRLLKLQGKSQKFGTQVVDEDTKILKMYKVNPKTTDKERKKYGLPPLKYLKEYLNKK